LLAFAHRRYVENFVGGPYDLGPADLDAVRDVSEAPRYFARVTGSKAVDTGLQQITVRRRGGVDTNRSVSASYYALVVGDKLLLCKTATGPRTTFDGELAAMPAAMAGQLFDSPEMQAIRNRFYPFYLDDGSFRLPGYIAVAGLLVFGIVLVKQAVPAWEHWQDPASHPTARRAEAWGDPIGLAAAVEKESRAPRHKGANGWAITDQFLIRSTFFSFDLLRLSDLLWSYKKVTKHSVNFIPTGKSYEAVLVCDGGIANLTGSEKTVDGILGFAARRAPWAIFGFSNEIQQYFSREAASFSIVVEQRKREWAEQAAVQARA
jgi:hypothetical protein